MTGGAILVAQPFPQWGNSAQPAFLVGRHQSPAADDVRRQNGRQLALDPEGLV